jgi:hypothetical protein
MNTGRIITRDDGKKFHIGGRRRPVARGPRLALRNYLDLSKLLAPVPDCDYSSAPGLTDVLANDSLGDCTCAGVLHALEAINNAAGQPVTFTAAQAIALYSAACGYVVGDASTDNGGDELTVLDYVAEHGVDGNGFHQIIGSILVDATNPLECRWALYNLCNLYYGVGLPDAWLSPWPSNGATWDVGTADPNNGHCFVANKSVGGNFGIDTWGESLLITQAATSELAVQAQGGELHTIITKDLIGLTSGKNPPGTFGLADLLSDLQTIGALAA